MQVQHETQLLEGSPVRLDVLSSIHGKSLDSYALTQNLLAPIDSLLNCPTNNNITAVYLGKLNQIIILDTKIRARRERFPLKACDKKFSKQSFIAKGLDFSPDGQRIVVGQSDSIIYIYKLPNAIIQSPSKPTLEPTASSAKPTITGKFVCSSPISCLIWTEFGVVFGTQDGKVKLILMPTKSVSSNESAKVVGLHSPVKSQMPISLSYKANQLAIGYLDSTIILLSNLTIDQLTSSDTLATSTSTTIVLPSSRRNSSVTNAIQTTLLASVTHTSPANHLVILNANSLCCSGSDGRVSFYSVQVSDAAAGKVKLSVELRQSIDIRDDITSMDYSSLNETIVLATISRMQFVSFEQESSSWRLQNSFINMGSLATITRVLWTRDGSQLLVGASNGSLDLFKCNWSKQSLGEQLDICHIAKNRVRITDRSRNLLATYKTHCDIKRVNLLDRGSNVIIWTTGSLLLARLARTQSEISWNGDRNAKFCFDFPSFVLIYKPTSKELSLVRLGQDSVLLKLKLDQVNRKLVSICRFPPDLQEDGTASNRNSPMRERSATKTLRQASIGSEDPRLTVPEIQLADSSSNSIDSHVDNTQEKPETIRERFVFVADSGYSLNMVDLKTNARSMILRHQVPIKETKFCLSGSHLIFTDSREKLFILSNLDKQVQEPKLIANECKFSDWLPETDILVAQSQQKILIWYSLSDLKGEKTELDSRGYNSIKQAPILDLSLLTTRTPYPVVTKASWENLYLSNGSTIPLDKFKIKFDRELLCRGLESAFEVLSREDTSTASSNLWSRLGWLAVDHSNLNVAIKSFSKLGYKSLIEFLDSCNGKSKDEQHVSLMKLSGKWDSFEKTVEPDEILNTYRRLNKWSRLIDYLTRTQQFRQRDLAEQDHRSWLVSRQRYEEAANSLAQSGDLVSALRMLIENQKFAEAANLLVASQRTPLRNLKTLTQLDSSVMNLANQLKFKLIELQKFKEAARVSDKALGDAKEALELYLRGKDYQPALQIAAEIEPNRMGEIESKFGDHLIEQYKSNRLSGRLASAAIDHYLSANLIDKALESAIELRQYDRAYEVLRKLQQEGGQLVKTTGMLQKLADYLISKDQREKAVDVLKLTKQYSRMVELHRDQGEYEKAFEISLRHIYESNRELASEEYIELAKNLANQGKSQEAEQIYLMLDKSDLAIEMHKQLKNYDRILELTEQLHPDLLEATLFQLAKELEISGRYEQAEAYLLRASPSEWVNVVRMHRVAGRYADAYRVARANCSSEQDPLLVQLAFWWAKSLVMSQDGEVEAPEIRVQKARDLLTKLNVMSQVVEFCCENKNFQFALDLCETSDKDTKREVLRRYATFLEQQHKFGQAEEILLRHGQVELVARMYIDNDMQSDAIRVVEEQLATSGSKRDQTIDNREQLVELLNDTLIQCANKLAEDAWPGSGSGSSSSSSTRPTTAASWDGDSMNKLATAQQLYLRAQRPELAVDLYKQRGLWQEAIQVAQRFAPRLLEGVERALDEQVSDDLGPIVAVAAASRSSSRSSLTPSDKSGSLSTLNPTMRATEPTGGRLKLRTEVSMRDGNLVDTRVALGKFMNSITNGEAGTNGVSSSNQTATWLASLEQMIRNQSSQLSIDDNWLAQIISLFDKISRSCCWIQTHGLSMDDYTVWLRLRDNLVSCLETMHHRKQVGGIANDWLDQLKSRIQVAHLVVLHGTLAGHLADHLDVDTSNGDLRSRASQFMSTARAEKLSTQLDNPIIGPITQFMAKLSLSLLRYSCQSIEPRCAFYTAGFWLLAAGNRQLARIMWTRWMELIDNTTSKSRVERDLRLLDISSPSADSGKSTCEPSGQQVAELRAWLLSSLIDDDDDDEANSASKLDERRLYESSLRLHDGDLAPEYPVCLATGYPVFNSTNRLMLGTRLDWRHFVRSDQWQQLLELRERLEKLGATKSRLTPANRVMRLKQQTKSTRHSVPLGEIVNFIKRLSGHES